jgi:hypothetical protein
VPYWSYSQDSLATVEIDLLRKASLLIIEGDECNAALSNKVAQIEFKDLHIEELQAIRLDQESIIDAKNNQLILMDSLILNKDFQIEEKDKEIKKYKLISGGAILTALLLVLFL